MHTYLWQLGVFILCCPICSKQPRTSFSFYKFFYPTISGRISGNTYFWAWLHFCLNKRLFLHFGTNCSYIIFCLIFLLRQDMYHYSTTTTHHTRHFCATLLYIFIEKGLFPTYCYVDLYVVVCLNYLLITISRL